MPGIVFLDFDGPIFPTKAFVLPENNGEMARKGCEELNLHPYVTYWKADPISIAMLNNLYEIYPYELVISSSWADDWLHQKEQIEGVLLKNELNYKLHRTWRTPRDQYKERQEQIGHWLFLHPEYREQYIILDDTASGAGLADEDELAICKINPSNVFLVDIHNGISHEMYQKIGMKMRNWK